MEESQPYTLPYGCTLQATEGPKAGAEGLVASTTHFTAPQTCQGVAASPLQRAQHSFLLQQPASGYPTWAPHWVCVETQMGAQGAIDVGLYCRSQMRMQENSSKSQQAPSCKEGPQRCLLSSPSAASKGCAKLPEMHQDSGRSREM